MKHAGIERPAKVPESAVQHWEGNGWQRTDPPLKPLRPTAEPPAKHADPPPATRKTADVADAKTADPTTKKPSTRRKED